MVATFHYLNYGKVNQTFKTKHSASCVRQALTGKNVLTILALVSQSNADQYSHRKDSAGRQTQDGAI